MLLDSLGFHSQIYAFPYETELIPYTLKQLDSFGDLAQDENFFRLWQKVGHFPAFMRANANAVPPIPQNWRDFPRTLSAVLDAYLSAFARKSGKQRWCEKTPLYLLHLLQLNQLFPDARFLHIIRDGRDCAASLHRRWKSTPEFTIYRWKHAIRLGREAGEALGARYMEIRYEDLTRETRVHMKRICEFLDIPFEEAMLHSPQRHKAGRKDVGKIEANSGKWQRYFPEKTQRALEGVAGKMLKESGYALEYDEAEWEPGSSRLRYWKLKDYINHYRLIVWRKLTGKLSKRSWGEIFMIPFATLKRKRHDRF